jgi:hypothetical protein
MAFRSWFAAGIGLALLHTHSAAAGQHKVRHHLLNSVHRHSVQFQNLHNRKPAKPSADAKELTALKNEIRDLRKQVSAVQILRQELAEIESLRTEMVELKDKVWGVSPMLASLSFSPRPQSASVVEPKEVTLKIPDLSGPYPEAPQAPINPATAVLPAVIEERLFSSPRPSSELEEAMAYLIDTATPGYTMKRQGVSLAIARLHPAFVVKLAEAVKRAREAGLNHAGVYSAYRPPAFRIGGFKNKFNSLHAYGLAVDMTGIGRARSKAAYLWQSIINTVGLYLPYGPRNRAEFNHTQLVPTKVASIQLRQTISASEPKDLHQMWLASGIKSYVADITLAEASKPDVRASDEEPTGALGQGRAAEKKVAHAGRPSRRRAAPKKSRSTGNRTRRSKSRTRTAGRRTKSKTRQKAG